MYNNFIVSVREYCRRIKKSLLEQNDDFLLSYSQNYRKFKLFSYWITKIFAYLNRFYVVHSKKHRLEKICQKIFKINVLEKETSKLVEKITQEIGKMRTEHLSVDSEKIRACFDSFVEIDSSQQLFREKVAKPVLKQTEDFYKQFEKI
ncbi:hypothetical protein MHBO_004271 [Bonamia ostreae]|uniref:Cullin N-terminal domain-containing protein n=1 Tax=Bonamia ostreae TaxID=126728 RepID=A0ABV2ATM3_9EUKA